VWPIRGCVPLPVHATAFLFLAAFYAGDFHVHKKLHFDFFHSAIG